MIASAEAAAAALDAGTISAGGDATADAVADATSLLQQQATFYTALCSGDVDRMAELFAGAEPDAAVSEVLAAGGRAQAQQCDLAMLQSHLAAVQQECCFDDSISDLQENLVAVRICDTELVLLPASYVACCQSRAATDRLQRHP